MEYFIDKNLNRKAVRDFFENAKKENNEIHTLQIYKNNRLILKTSQSPYSCEDIREIYSLSKSFTSTVVGIASDMGYLSTEDLVLKYFPEFKTENVHFNNLRIKHLLSMNTGHSACVMPYMRLADEAWRGFFEKEPEFEPGTHFAYNTGATCLLGIIILRATGKNFFDFACEKLFYPLEIYNISWSRCHDGSCQCGTGLHISNNDIAKFGLMLYNNGVYNEKRIVSQEWIKEASSYISDNSQNGTHDWSSGYGYQFWINKRDGYRGDGAFGQLCLILPKHEMVVTVQAYCSCMQKEIDMIFDLIDIIDEQSEGFSESVFEPFERNNNITHYSAIYELEENLQGFKNMNLSVDEEELILAFNDGVEIQTVRCGNGKWVKSEFRAKNMYPLLTNLMTTEYVETIRIAGCFEKTNDGYKAKIRYLSNPHTEYFIIKTNDDKISIDIDTVFRKENIKHLCGKKL